MCTVPVSLIFLCQQLHVFIIRIGISKGNTDTLPQTGLNCLKDHRTATFEPENVSIYDMIVSDIYGVLIIVSV